MFRPRLGALSFLPPILAFGCAQPAGGGGAVVGAGNGGGGGIIPVQQGALPCDVSSVLVASCQSCHGTNPLYGAPMSLVTYADTQAPSHSNPSLRVWQMMQMRVHASTASTVMPPAGYPPLSAAQLATLDGWFGAGAPPGTTACGGGGGGSGGSTGAGAGGATGAGGGSVVTGAGGSGAAGGVGGGGPITTPLPCTPNHTLTAHAMGSTAKYPVPNPTSDQYFCFNFKSPFAAGEQATALGPVIDDARVIHHWLLYGTNSTLTDGSIQGGCVIPTVSSSDTLVAGWAPGGQNTVFDPDVGLVLDYAYFQLQVHYNNNRYADAADASGVAFCTTTTPRQNAAGVVELGSMLFNIPANANDYPVSGTCSNLATDNKTTMTVLYTTPHMHLLGTGFKTQHMRGSMNMGDLSNVPLGTWSFENQRHYDTLPRRQVQPGDVLTTTCYYDNPSPNSVGFGNKTSDEMCFDFVAVFPYAVANKKCGMVF